MRRMRMTEIEALSRKCFCLLGEPQLSWWSHWLDDIDVVRLSTSIDLHSNRTGTIHSASWQLGKAEGRQPAISPECVGKREEYGNDEKSSMLDYQPARYCSCGPCLVSRVSCVVCRRTEFEFVQKAPMRARLTQVRRSVGPRSAPLVGSKSLSSAVFQ